ncbi:DUF2894 domain-containing protein [Rhodoferax sp. GW822-FHT02A01]|uniref:DUF2894 domain-containing protein n=1 Tax=Rhodoferax sp. GW822-FHT02A01 TaxID=3141537 RepID=UPI00315D9178
MTAQHPSNSTQSADALPELASPAPDWCAQIAALRQHSGAQREQVRLHYLDLLATRVQTQQEPVKRMLEAKLIRALQELQSRLDQNQPPSVHDGAQATGAASAMSPLRALVHSLSQYSADSRDASDALAQRADATARPELKSVRKFRKTWSRLSTDKQLRQALDQAPKNAGPINSHMLVLRSLALMRDISPDYMNRFMSYADALLCLEQSEKTTLPAAKPRRARRAAK